MQFLQEKKILPRRKLLGAIETLEKSLMLSPIFSSFLLLYVVNVGKFQNVFLIWLHPQKTLSLKVSTSEQVIWVFYGAKLKIRSEIFPPLLPIWTMFVCSGFHRKLPWRDFRCQNHPTFSFPRFFFNSYAPLVYSVFYGEFENEKKRNKNIRPAQMGI